MNATELEMAKALEESKFRFFVTFTMRYRNAWRLRPLMFASGNVIQLPLTIPVQPF